MNQFGKEPADYSCESSLSSLPLWDFPVQPPFKKMSSAVKDASRILTSNDKGTF
jgi:hypothetical protein